MPNKKDEIEISDKLKAAVMKAVRMSPEEAKKFEKALQGMVDNLNKNVEKEEEES